MTDTLCRATLTLVQTALNAMLQQNLLNPAVQIANDTLLYVETHFPTECTLDEQRAILKGLELMSDLRDLIESGNATESELHEIEEEILDYIEIPMLEFDYLSDSSGYASSD